MEKRISLELLGRKPEEVEELILDNCKSPTIDGLTDQFSNLKVLWLNNAGLTTLKGFPCLPKLRKLELSDNRISSGLSALTQCTALASLNLSGNNIKELSELTPLAELKKLQKLDLFHCEVTDIVDYRAEVFKMLPGLVGLDGLDTHDHEVFDSDLEDDSGDEDDEDTDEDEDADEEDQDDEVGLSAIYKDDINDGEENDGDYEAGEEEDDDDVLDEELDNSDLNTSDKDGERGTKRKHDEEEQEEAA